MKIEIGKRYLDRQGAEVEILSTHSTTVEYPLLGRHENGSVVSYTNEGVFYRHMPSEWDLIAPAIDPAEQQQQQHPVPLWQQLRDTWKGGSVLPKASNVRKDFPLWSGFDAYFPAAIVAVAGWSKTANEKHNPGLPLQHARGKSADHQDCQRRHAIDSADPTCDKLEELTCKAWRALAELQEYAETLGAPPAPAATFPETNK